MANNNNLGDDYYAMLIAEAEAAEQQQGPRNNRQNAINSAVAAARTAFNRNFRNEASALGLNNAQQEQEYMNLMIQESKASREAAKGSANAALYNEAKAVLLSEDKKLRQSVLKEVALDDIIIEERIKLAHAKTDEERRAAATKIYNAEKLKGELSDARQQNRGPSAEQNARYANLTRNVNFNAIPFSLYPRLRGNNATRTANNERKAATKIAAFKRGYTTRKQYKPQLNALRAAREAERARQMAALPMVPMVPFEEAPKPKGHIVGGPNAAPPPVSAAERRRLMAEAAAKRFAKKPNQGGKRKTQRRR